VAALPVPLPTLVALLLVVAVIALVAWALQLMQAANDRREFSLMLAGCMVCSAAVGLATVMVLTLTGPGHGPELALGRLGSSGIRPARISQAEPSPEFDALPETFSLPWDGQL